MEANDERGHGPSRRVTIGLIATIAVIAIALRFWRLSWGLHDQLGFPDEAWIFNPYADAFTSLSWESLRQRSIQYPTLYGYLVGLTALALRSVGIVDGPLTQFQPAAFIAGRSVSAVMGVVGVGIVGLTAGRMYSRRAGLIAAALLAVTPFSVLYGHLASTDATLLTLAALTILCAHAAASGGGNTALVATGAAAGLTFATKYTGVAMLVSGAWVILERAYAERSPRRTAIAVLALGLGFAAAFALGCPPCVLMPGSMLEGMRHLYGVTTAFSASFTNYHLTPTLGWYGRPYLFQLVAALPYTLGWPLYAASLAGIAMGIWRRERADRLLLVALLSFFLSIGASQVVFPRYLMPLFPGLVVLAARALGALRRPRWAGPALIGGVWLYSAVLSGTQVARFSLDQQSGVAEWIARSRTLGLGRRVGVPEMMLDYYRLMVPLKQRRLKQVDLHAGHWFDEPAPDFIVVPEWYAIGIARDRPDGPEARDLERLRSGAAGYVRGPRWGSTYLQRDFYSWLDPAYAVQLWQGEIGFTVYVRDPAAPPPGRAGSARRVAPPAPTASPG